jgi:hypothetical protein
MNLIPWHRKKRDAIEERERAEAALRESQARGRVVEGLARELEDIRRRNHLAPRIAAAFQYTRPNGSRS